MSAWGTRRQLSFIFVFILFLIAITVALIFLNRHVPSCSDNIQNQGELGPDCGGPCTKVCAIETNNLVVLWNRVFKVRDGVYDVAAFVENTNPFGLASVPYHIRVYDTENIPVKDIDGTTYLNPHERALIFEPQINVGFRNPTRAFISFPDTLDWKRLNKAKEPTLVFTNQRIENQPILTLRATLTNESLFAVGEIELDAVLYGPDGNALHVSRTYVDSLASGASKEVFFTWPEAPAGEVLSADIYPRVNLVEGNIINTLTVSPQ